MEERQIMKCGDCSYREDSTEFYHKRKIFRCVWGKHPHYRVGKNTYCIQVYKKYYPDKQKVNK